MSSPICERVRGNPKFHELVARRTRFAGLLSAVSLASWYGFMMVVAFAPDLLRVPVAEGAAITVGVPVGAAIVVLGWLLTGWYVHRANTEFDSYDHPALFSMPLAFLVSIVVSRLDRSASARRERAAFDDQHVRAQTGLGIVAAASH